MADTSIVPKRSGADVGASGAPVQEVSSHHAIRCREPMKLRAPMKPKFLRTAAEFRTWLQRHHATAAELLVGFYKRPSGKPSITWPESVDEALCYGWIDGIRKRVDDERYTIRFTPRRSGSIWSAVNTRRARTLAAQGRMTPAGLSAFAARRPNRSRRYSYEQRPRRLVAPYAGMLARNAAARKFFLAQIPSYRRAATWWVLSAKKEETRLKRARALIELSARGKQIPQFLRPKARSRRSSQRALLALRGSGGVAEGYDPKAASPRR
jgi:uncharacterized protein YdeI (YjbR/CyaY-like superfamily)